MKGKTMSTFQDVFERREQKYIITTEQYRRFLERTAGYLVPDEHATSMVMSLYYDTSTYEMINRSLERPVYKEKLRLRSYGVPRADSVVFVEIKKKFEGVVYKRRVGMSYLAAKAYMNGVDYHDAVITFPLADAALQEQALCAKSMQISREIDFLRKREGYLRPTMLICTRRDSYISVDEAIRITFDRGPVWRTDQLDLDHGMEGAPLLEPGQVIMEIKAIGAYPLSLVDILDELEVYPSSCSKYGRAYVASCVPTSATCVTRPVIVGQPTREPATRGRVPVFASGI